MKNIIKITLGILFIIGALISCDKENVENITLEMSEEESAEFFKQNISIYDAIVRSINKGEYVKELHLANFSDKQWDKTSVGFDGYLFEDNGLGNDLVANDDIYTSVEKFNHNVKVPYIEDVLVRSVLEMPIVSPDFIRMTELESFSFQYKLKRPTNSNAKLAGPVATLECDVEICSTGCIADWIWDGFGCICVSNCRAKIGWE